MLEKQGTTKGSTQVLRTRLKDLWELAVEEAATLSSALVFIFLANVSPAILWTVTRSRRVSFCAWLRAVIPVTYSVVPQLQRLLQSLLFLLFCSRGQGDAQVEAAELWSTIKSTPAGGSVRRDVSNQG